MDISTLELGGKTGAVSGANGEKGAPRRSNKTIAHRHSTEMPRCHDSRTALFTILASSYEPLPTSTASVILTLLS